MNETQVLPDIKLRFNIEHPSLEEAYRFGYECARAEVGEEENPFVESTLESEHWSDGWWAGFYEEKPAFASLDEVLDPLQPVNDHDYQTHHQENFLVRFLEISGVLVVSAFVGYQLIELVA